MPVSFVLLELGSVFADGWLLTFSEGGLDQPEPFVGCLSGERVESEDGPESLGCVGEVEEA